MKIAPVADVKARLSTYLEACNAEGPVGITRNGRAVAVLLAPRDDEDLERLVLARSPRFQELLQRSRPASGQDMACASRNSGRQRSPGPGGMSARANPVTRVMARGGDHA